MTHRILPAIMSGGAGTRLWPLSTEAEPKQFHAFGGGLSLFAETVRRVSGDAGGLSFAAPLVAANAAHLALVKRHLAAAGAEPSAIVLEPVGRNTAAVGAIAAALGHELEPGALVLLLPADHVIADRAAFLMAIARAAPIARDRIVTFGITPDRPETGYGYIKAGAELAPGVFAIESFREKPDVEAAAALLAEGGYAWNAGMFLFDPHVLLEEFAHAPKIRDGALQALAQAVRRDGVIYPDAAAFAAIPAAPLDTALMEKTRRAAVAPCAIGWADVGSWSEIWRLAEKDAAGNALQGGAAVLDGANNLVRGDGVKVCVAGVRDLIVIATADGVIVLPRARAQDVKALRDLALGNSD
jgi:mannose-1-phosphate guanylyltransferase/mannose-6-phosphate isomerase